MDYKIGSWIIVQQANGHEALVIVTFKNDSGFRGNVPVTDKLVVGMTHQIKDVVRH
jgi:hypothetical protein